MTRPVPTGAILKVAGVSHRQDVVRTVKEGDPVRICHDPANGADEHACAIATADGRLLGFVPRAGGLAERMATSAPNGCWSGVVHEVLTGDLWGLRVKLGPLVATAEPARPGAGVPGNRSRVDLVDDDGTALPTPPDCAAAGDASGEGAPRQVSARSGRALGTLVRSDSGRVWVRGSDGQERSYPAAVVRIAAA